jgi:hypothetical protein
MKRCGVAVVSAFLILLVAPAGAAAQDKCAAAANASPAPADATDLVELAPNANQPTFEVTLGDKKEVLDDELRLGRKGSIRLGAVSTVAADLIDPPRAGTKRLQGNIQLAAVVNQSQTRVVTYACVTSTSRWDAGRYEGSLLLYGPNLQDFTYAFVVTTKWPWWTAIGVLVVSALLFLLTALWTGSLIYQSGGMRSNVIPTIVGVIFSIFAVAPVYWSSYVNNATWGSDPGSQILGLGAAGLTAATAGLAAAHRLFGGRQETGAKPKPKPKPAGEN